MAFQRGIIQSRGIGDIIIALPIAYHYYLQDEVIVWPICEEFHSIVRDAAPWVNWVPIETDKEGRFFLETPLQVFRDWGVDASEALYLYQYLSNVPENTDPELFNILKFDQYKYAVAGVPFRSKWELSRCITRDSGRELALKERLNLPKRYAVCHLNGSSARVDIAIARAALDPAVQLIDVDLFKTESIFDWITVIEEAEAVVCIDSCFANMIDQLCITRPDLYWIRRSSWDLTPVLGSQWTVIPTNLPVKEPTRVDPAVEAAKKAAAVAASQPKAAVPGGGSPGLTSHVPFETNKTGYPTSFMSALRK
jgi:hypothetical protein